VVNLLSFAAVLTLLYSLLPLLLPRREKFQPAAAPFLSFLQRIKAE
jgi:hypothetical protein